MRYSISRAVSVSSDESWCERFKEGEKCAGVMVQMLRIWMGLDCVERVERRSSQKGS